MSKPTGKSVEIVTPPQRELAAAAGRMPLAITTPHIQPLVRVGGPINGLLMRWQGKREAKTYRAMAESVRSQTEFVNARAELSRTLVSASRDIAQLRELPLVLEHDSRVRELRRQAEMANAQRETAEARYGLDATLEEIAGLRAKQRKKATAREKPALNALVKAKHELEAVGRDTSDIDEVIAKMTQLNGAGV